MRTRSLLALVVSFLAMGVVALPASAHSELLQSTPADGEQLTEAPAEIELVFGEAVQQQGGAIIVKGPDGTRYDRAASFTTDENVATIGLVAATDPGEYSVAYRVVSADGHVVSDTFAYELLATDSSPTAVQSTPDASPLAGTPTDDGAGAGSDIGFVWVLGLGAIGLVLLAAVIAVAVRGRRGREG
jgi:methionine-rich copper-binding protein CopC